MKKITIEDLLVKLRSLRLTRDKADAAFLLACIETEREHWETIEASGATSFCQWLKSEGLVDPGRYESFKAGLAKLKNEKLALEIGSEATITAAHLTGGNGKAPPRKEAFVKAVSAWRAEHGSALPSREAAERLLRQVDPRESIPNPVKRQDELAVLRAENQDLRAKLRAAEARVKKLEAEIARLRPRQPRA